MNEKEAILKKFRDHYNNDHYINFRRLKKIIQPLINIEDAEALLLFGILLSGSDSSSKERRSKQMLESAAKLEFPPAISTLAETYYNKGIYSKAYPLYYKAADLEEQHALFVLSAALKFGIDGLEKDLKLSQQYESRAEKAKKWDFITGYSINEFLLNVPI